jgi:hypothetical protein
MKVDGKRAEERFKVLREVTMKLRGGTRRGGRMRKKKWTK